MKRYLLGIAILLPILIVWWIYRFDECKKVGHSTFYCIATFDK